MNVATEASIIGGEHYTVGNTLRLSIEIRQADVLVDPSGEITVIIDLDDAALQTEIYNGGAGNVVKDAVGQYHYDLDLAASGLYEYRWKTINPNGARESYFIVPVSRVTAP